MYRFFLLLLISTNIYSSTINYKEFTKKIRCTVCQNQTLYDSDAPLAISLKEEILTRINAKQSEKEINQFLERTYGEYIFYEPPVNNKTMLLWAIPFILLFGSISYIIRLARL